MKLILFLPVYNEEENLEELLNKIPRSFVNIDDFSILAINDGSKDDSLKILEKHDVESIVYTDIAKDGTLEGPNFESLSKVARITNIPIIASGGVSNLADVKKLRTMADSGIKACIVGKAILAGRISLSELFA